MPIRFKTSKGGRKVLVAAKSPPTVTTRPGSRSADGACRPDGLIGRGVARDYVDLARLGGNVIRHSRRVLGTTVGPLLSECMTASISQMPTRSLSVCGRWKAESRLTVEDNV